MKTLYLDHHGPLKVILDDPFLSKIQRAKDRVYQISLEEDWNPSLEIDLKLYDENHHVGNSAIKVETNGFNRLGQGQQVIGILSGQISDQYVTATIGHYCYEGWDTFCFRDVLDIPDLYFDSKFIFGLVEGYNNWDIIEGHHLKTALAKVYKYLANYAMVGYHDIWNRDLNKLAQLTKQVYRNQANLVDLQQAISQHGS